MFVKWAEEFPPLVYFKTHFLFFNATFFKDTIHLLSSLVTEPFVCTMLTPSLLLDCILDHFTSSQSTAGVVPCSTAVFQTHNMNPTQITCSPGYGFLSLFSEKWWNNTFKQALPPFKFLPIHHLQSLSHLISCYLT
jgi:hypothetical protein